MGLFINKLSYLIVLWGGCGTVLKHSIQVIQNKAARLVTRVDWSVPTAEVLQQCGWLSVNQLCFYHAVLQVFKVKQTKTPKYLHSMHHSSDYIYKTRQADSGQIKLKSKPKLDISKNSYRWRAATQYNMLPSDIRNSESVAIFKLRVKTWIRTNVSLY